MDLKELIDSYYDEIMSRGFPDSMKLERGIYLGLIDLDNIELIGTTFIVSLSRFDISSADSFIRVKCTHSSFNITLSEFNNFDYHLFVHNGISYLAYLNGKALIKFLIESNLYFETINAMLVILRYIIKL